MEEKNQNELSRKGTSGRRKSATYGQIIKYTGILSSTQVLTMLVAVVRNKLATVFLGAAGMGLTALYQSLMVFLSNITNLGIPMSAIKHVSDRAGHASDEEVNRYVAVIRTWIVVTAVIGTVVCVLLAPVLNYFSFHGQPDHTLDIMLLAPMIGFLGVTGGELALLKAARQLKNIAVVSLAGGVFTMLATIPFYYFFQERGIVPALLCSTFLVMCVHIHYARKAYPWRLLKPSREIYRQGMDVVRLGLAFIVSSIFASMAEWLIPVYILKYASLEEVAFFKMGFSLIVTYPGMVFVALEADYYPRLSAIHDDCKLMNESVNQQIEICVMLIVPVLIAFVMALPFVVPLLYTREFLPIVDMAVCGSIYMLFRAVTMPLAFIPLVKNNLTVYLIVELMYNVFLFTSVVVCFMFWGVTGGGVALGVTGLLDMTMLLSVYRWRYHFVLLRRIAGNIVVQGVLMVTVILVCLFTEGLLKYALAGVVLLLSMAYTWNFLKRNTGIMQRIRERFRK